MGRCTNYNAWQYFYHDGWLAGKKKKKLLRSTLS